MKTPRKIILPCTYCGSPVERYRSSQVNPKTGEIRKIVKCPDCRRVDPAIRFWRMVDKNPNPTGCWLWTGAKSEDGYAHFPYPEIGQVIGSRVSWILTNGKIPKGFYILHDIKCPHRHCVNPAHLSMDSQSKNMLDSVAAGTHYAANHPGEKHYNATLTDDAVREIRREYRRGVVKLLADKFGVSIATIRDVYRRKSWKHVS